MDEYKEELATIETLDSGAVYTLALKTHVGMSVDTFRYFAGWCDKIQVYTVKILILRPPLGLSKSGLKDHFWTVPKVVSNQMYSGCRK